MPAQPSNPQPTEDASVRAPRKRQIPLDANGEPVTGSAPKKQKSAPEKTGKKKTAPAKPAPPKTAASKTAALKTIPVKAASAKRVEAAASDDSDESDDNIEYRVPSPAATEVDADEELDKDGVEAPEEDDEAELGAYCT
jgi:hypothetical protein